MRRIRALLAGLLSVWLPVDAAVAGWWHHHHRGTPVAYGPMPVAPCGGPPAPWAGWEHAVIIDDRPASAPACVAVTVAFPVVETIVVEQPITVAAVYSQVDDPIAGSVVDGGSASVGCACAACDEGIEVGLVDTIEGTPVGESVILGADPVSEVAVETVPAAEPSAVETVPEGVSEAPTPLELPGDTANVPAATTAAPTDPGGPGDAESVLEPREPVTLQGESPVALERADSFEPPVDDATDTPMEEEPMEDADDGFEEERPATAPKARSRNLFDEAPGGDADAADDFGAPADDDGGVPDEPPMDDAPPSFPADEKPMEEAPADDSGFEIPAGDASDAPMVEGDDAGTGEAPAPEAPAADPFDSSRIRVPAEPTRRWQDDTGRFSTEGKLVEIRPGSVRILKSTGRHTTVPLERLSDADREHVTGVRRSLAARRPTTGDTAALR